MTYKIKRFSYVDEGLGYIDSGVDYTLDGIDGVTTRLIENERTKDLRPVKKYGKFLRTTSRFLKSKKKKKHKEFSTTPELTKERVPVADANAFKVELTRLTGTMSSSSGDTSLLK